MHHGRNDDTRQDSADREDLEIVYILCCRTHQKDEESRRDRSNQVSFNLKQIRNIGNAASFLEVTEIAERIVSLEKHKWYFLNFDRLDC